MPILADWFAFAFVGGIFMKMIQDLGMIYPTETSKHKRRFGIFECPYCGNNFKTEVQSALRGDVRTCGCSSYLIKSNKNYKHGGSGMRVYNIWKKMVERCYNENFKQYKDYGGCGISVCSEWKNDFTEFRKWAYCNGYDDVLKIERKNPYGNYEPENCEWADDIKQGQNTKLLQRNNKSGYRGVRWCDKLNKWNAQIRSNRKSYNLGYYDTKEMAAHAYNNFIIEHKTFHPLNIIIST